MFNASLFAEARATFWRSGALSALMMLVMVVSVSAADDLYAKYKQIYVGQARPDIVNLLGAPTTENRTDILGLSYSTLRWQSARSGPAVTIRLVGGRLVASQYCERSADC